MRHAPFPAELYLTSGTTSQGDILLTIYEIRTDLCGKRWAGRANSKCMAEGSSLGGPIKSNYVPCHS
jgi:hypothetical protein